MQKQFRQTNVKQLNVQKEEDSSQGVAFSFAGSDQGNVSDSAFLAPEMQNQHEPITSKEKSISVHDRLRIPVSYDDDLLGENPVNDAT
jgi:phosphorylated adapter RNA export protein